ncbi:hypothetical protein GL218_02454 [Daldinia childiae]|uniref:uncharacterized protein n=1 Tax=Daldinia childiae TaxID=326645 RepID=UPI0014479D7D|nr:uncharacterized protein GL218_02454 [Daldinia childiae]KAF3064311.1 hypothetical protein GL218_02454 [Daldinia childiae]
MMFAKFLFARVFLVSLLHLAIAISNGTTSSSLAGPPSCASRCMVDSMFVTQCLDTRCLCNEKDYQKSLFQCLYSQCDSNNYGPALSHSISLCMSFGAEIYMAAPGTVNDELLRSREEDYLAGREVEEVPHLQLRQESVAGIGTTITVTTTVTDFITVSYSLITYTSNHLTPSPFLETSQAAEVTTTSSSRPWVIPVSEATEGARSRPSFFGLVLWVTFVIMLDYWMDMSSH